jgi:hypothetical protein
MKDEEIYQCLYEANSILIKNYFDKKITSYLGQTKKIYLEKDSKFRGFRQT